MCRFIAFHTKGEIKKKYLDGLLKASYNDVFSKYRSHSDGWGYVIFVKLSQKWRVWYYRSEEPIYQDENGLQFLESIRGDEIVGIVHARRSSKKFLVGLTHCHPYFLRAGPYDLYFAHNGSVMRKAFRDPYRPYTDSYVILEEIKTLIESDNQVPLEAYFSTIQRLKDYATSLNSSLIYFDKNNGPTLLVAYYYNVSRVTSSVSEEYYKLYINEENYIIPSTVKYYLNERESKELELGNIVEL
ncbi:glutamine amidotransferase [Sulfolobus sp. F1]|nr:glutamine amidotransferase [Sulfolobus sp. F1]